MINKAVGSIDSRHSLCENNTLVFILPFFRAILADVSLYNDNNMLSIKESSSERKFPLKRKAFNQSVEDFSIGTSATNA